MHYEFDKHTWRLQVDEQDGSEYIISENVRHANIVCARFGSSHNALLNWDKNKHILINAPELLHACIDVLYFLENMDNPRQEAINERIDTLQTATNKALNIK